MAAWAGLLLLQAAFTPLTTGLKTRPPPEWHIAERCANCTMLLRPANRSSHDYAEWEAFAKTFPTRTLVKSSGEKMCLLGAAVPEFYLLGSAKAGTSTFALDAMSLGFKSARGHEKELCTFDSHCNWPVIGISKEEWMDTDGGVCTKMTASDKERWADNFAPCKSSPMTSLADFSPINLRMPGLPVLMADLYGEQRSKLTFAILLREPLSRFQSHFYMLKDMSGNNGLFGETFAEHVEDVLSLAQTLDDQSIGQKYIMDPFFRSMYSKSMKPWLDEFKPEQFVIIPSNLYFKSASVRSSLLRHIGHRMSMEVDTTALETQPRSHDFWRPHPTVSEDLNSSQIHALRTRYYDPANSELFRMLAAAIPEGLTLYGFEGRPTPSEIGAFLMSSW